MLGAAGAVCSLAAGTAIGHYLKIRRMARFHHLQAALDILNAMRLLLETEHLALPDLLESCAGYAGSGTGAEEIAGRLKLTAQRLRQQPLEGLSSAYRSACSQFPCPWEQEEEKTALDSLFAQLGSGTAAMRAEACAACSRRLKPVRENAQVEAEKGGRLCMHLGMLLGLMAGIALW